MLTLRSVTKTYFVGGHELSVLKGITLDIESGEFVAFMGPSGSGKTTLLHVMGALDRPSSGVVNIHGSDISQMNEKALARLRNQTIGFVFQNFYLLPYYTALENVCLPLIYAGTYPEKKAAAQALLEQVGLGSRVHHKPNELSGGERQRVAIARSLINQPQILFADEPTGNLDSQNGESVMDILRQINTSGTTVILITHDPKIAGYAKRTLHVQDGEVS